MKSYVTMEQRACLICGKPYDTGNILVDRRMRDRFAPNTLTGIGLCPFCEGKKQEGYIALVECDGTKVTPFADEDGVDRVRGTAAEARTGRLMYMPSEVFTALFNVELPKEGLCYIDPETMGIVLERAKGHINVIDRKEKDNG